MRPSKAALVIFLKRGCDMKPYKTTLALLAFLPILLISPAAEAEFRQTVIGVKGLVCDS